MDNYGLDKYIYTFTIIIPSLCVFHSLIPRPLPDFISQLSGGGLGSLLRHELEMVDMVSTNRVPITCAYLVKCACY